GWLRIAALGAPGLLLAAAGNGWLRGIQDTRRPLLFVLGPNLLSAVLCPLLVYPAGLGLVGSAVANAIAQTLSGVLFAAALVRERVSLRPRPRVIGQQLVLSRDLLVRGVAFQASFLSATAVAARFGAAAVGAHQIAVQLWFFTALV
ncbi:MATE family efflux transporter, partial [Micromonospora aurantiaca]|nr:MATE family efflux transporter [Micromonospora aurantiaca]